MYFLNMYKNSKKFYFCRTDGVLVNLNSLLFVIDYHF